MIKGVDGPCRPAGDPLLAPACAQFCCTRRHGGGVRVGVREMGGCGGVREMGEARASGKVAVAPAPSLEV